MVNLRPHLGQTSRAQASVIEQLYKRISELKLQAYVFLHNDVVVHCAVALCRHSLISIAHICSPGMPMLHVRRLATRQIYTGAGARWPYIVRTCKSNACGR